LTSTNIFQGIEVVKLYKPSKKRKNRKPPQFTPTEISRHAPLIAGFKPVSQKGYLESKSGFVPLFYEQSNKKFITVGPIAPIRQSFSGQNQRWSCVKTSFCISTEEGLIMSSKDNVVYKTDAKELIPTRLYKIEYDPSNKHE